MQLTQTISSTSLAKPISKIPVVKIHEFPLKKDTDYLKSRIYLFSGNLSYLLLHNFSNSLDNPKLSQRQSQSIILDYEKVKQDNTEIADENNLQRLALKMQSYCYINQAEQRRFVANFINALQGSGKLRRRGIYSREIYEDAVNRTLCWVVLNIHQFNPEKGGFLSWVNYRLEMILREVHSETLEPFLRSQGEQVVRCKYQLTAIVNQVGQVGIEFWLTLRVKGIPINQQIISWLTILWQLYALRMANRKEVDILLKELAKISLFSCHLQQINSENFVLENVAQPEEQLGLSELLKEYIKSDPERICQKYVNNCPQATFQMLFLARMENKSWQEIGDSLSLTVATVKKFFFRQMDKVAPLIRQQVQQ